MKANNFFLNQSPEFWANVRTISQQIGYTDRKTSKILVPSIEQIKKAFAILDLATDHIEHHTGELTVFGKTLIAYFEYRSEILSHDVEQNLMNREQAELLFNQTFAKYQPTCPLPMNKQKGDKKNYAFLTGLVNMLIEAHIGDLPCDYDPRSLTTITHQRKPVRTLSRRVDGAFPAVVNPIAIWEIKEYYYTTTFGSRVADGVYESLLDGMEINELEQAGHQRIDHVLIVDDYFTWWGCGRSYLCRIIDMLHMGYLDEVIFGREVMERIPALAKQWVSRLDQQHTSNCT